MSSLPKGICPKCKCETMIDILSERIEPKEVGDNNPNVVAYRIIRGAEWCPYCRFKDNKDRYIKKIPLSELNASEAKALQKTIAEDNKRVGTTNMFKTVGLYLRGNKVIFEADFSSPEPNDVSYSNYCEFDMEEYKRGIIELRKNGKCVLVDSRCFYGGKLIVSADLDGKAVHFAIPFIENESSGLYPHSFSTEWTVDQISLPN